MERACRKYYCESVSTNLFAKQLKHAGIDRKSLIQFYYACIRSFLEYAR